MFCYDPKPKKEFCTLVAKKPVKKYQFMKDTWEKVLSYVSVYMFVPCSTYNEFSYSYIMGKEANRQNP